VDLLIDVAALARTLARPDRPALLDVRWRIGGPPGTEAYRAGHLPGATFADLDRDLARPPGPGGRHPLPEAGAFQAAMRRAGVRDSRAVVAYDEDDSMAASRAWWMLRYFGHQQVLVLDGGYRAWVAAGLPVEQGAGAATPGDFTARPGHMPLLGAAEAAALARAGRLLDARAGERYRGEVEPFDLVAGHIPGAVSAPAADSVTSGGHFRSAADLRARFAALGIAADPPGSPDPGPGPADPGPAAVGAYCGSGVTAAHEVLALALAGIPAALYVGSWSHWVTDPERPVAVGPDPG
jgi:thiosulfate/3-mercaptopyruvate sulfurtransferase